MPTICSDISSKVIKIEGGYIKKVFFSDGNNYPFCYEMILIPDTFKTQLGNETNKMFSDKELLKVGDSIIKVSGKNKFKLIRNNEIWEFEFYNHYYNLCAD